MSSESKIDTSLAEKYLVKYKKVVKRWPGREQTYEIIDRTKKRRLSSGLWSFEETTRVRTRSGDSESSRDSEDSDSEESSSNKWEDLARKIEENCELFCQLEYVLRGTNPRDVREGHIPLLCQYIRLQEPSFDEENGFMFEDGYPLYYVGYFLNKCFEDPFIMTSSETLAPLCYLVHELTCDVGLDIRLVITDLADDCIDRHPYEEPVCWCVVTSSADVEAAADAIVQSSPTAPWRIKKVVAHAEKAKELEDILKQKSKCNIEVSVYNNQKELHAAADHPLLLSIWSTDIGHVTQLANEAAASYIWINDYGNFAGPPRASLPLFQHSWPTNYGMTTEQLKKFNELARAWAKTSTTLRLNMVLGTLATSEDTSHAEELYDKIKDWKSSDTIEVIDGRIVTIIHQCPSAVQLVQSTSEADWVRCVLNGNALIVYYEEGVMSDLTEFGVPLIIIDSTNSNEETIYEKFHLNTIKVIKALWSKPVDD